MDQELNRKIDAFIEANKEQMLQDIAALVAINSVESQPAEGAPFGAGPRAALDKTLELADRMGLETCNCYRYCQQELTDYPQGYLERVVRELSCSKARLLHYFPMEANANPDDWCTEHLDHSCLTGLTLAMFIDENDNDAELAKCPDPDAGLYIRDRHGNPVKVSIPPHSLAFQTGLTLQEVSHGQFQAVYHKVRGAAVPGVARNTLAVFCQPNLNEPVNLKENFAEYALRVIDGFH